MKATEEFDFIIVGAGTAGCLLAERLSAGGGRRVLLLEAGGEDRWIWFHVPIGYLFAIGNPRADWMFRTEPEPGLGGRAIAYPRGKVIGGSSAINAMICMRGQAADYDHWRALGLPGWGWSDVLPAFRRIEDHFMGESAHHGAGGGWRVEAPRVSWRALDAVRNAAIQMGVPPLADFNCGDNEGVSYFHINQRRGRRWSAARGFLRPALARGTLRLETHVHVQRLLLENKRAVGVRAWRDGQEFDIRARGEVISCAGAIGSPHLLSLSGIGRHAWLEDLGISTVIDHPGVGSNLQDHLQVRSVYRVHGVRTLNEMYHSPLQRVWMTLDYLARRRGPLTMAPSQLGIFMRSDGRQDRSNLEFHVQPLSLDSFGQPLHAFPAITVSVCNLRPTSRGTVRPRNPDPFAAPEISPRYLSTSEDRSVAAQSLRAARRLMSQPALQNFAPQEYQPGPDCGDGDTELSSAASRIATTIFHPVGTVRMGPDRDTEAVLDAQLRVRGIERLRVVDASVMPTITSGNTNTPTAMIAQRGAELITETWR